MPSLGRWIGIWPSQIFRRLLLSQVELGLATNTLLICSGDKPACRQSYFAGFAGFRRCCSRFKHAQKSTGRTSHAVAGILINPISSTRHKVKFFQYAWRRVRQTRGKNENLYEI